MIIGYRFDAYLGGDIYLIERHDGATAVATCSYVIATVDDEGAIQMRDVPAQLRDDIGITQAKLKDQIKEYINYIVKDALERGQDSVWTPTRRYVIAAGMGLEYEYIAESHRWNKITEGSAINGN